MAIGGTGVDHATCTECRRETGETETEPPYPGAGQCAIGEGWCFIHKDAAGKMDIPNDDPDLGLTAVTVAPACYLQGDTNPTPANPVDWQCQICRPTGSGYLIPGTNSDWKRESWNVVEMDGTPCNDNNLRTHTGVPASCL